MKRIFCAMVLASMAAQALVSAQVNAPKPLKFHVASVKRNTSGESRAAMGRAPTGIRFINVTLQTLLQSAFALQDFQVVGGPRAAHRGSNRFDRCLRLQYSVESAGKLSFGSGHRFRIR